ncbi:hypothetical protein LWI28_002952 [Acer negundo]|uniref:Glycerol-3-phosphate dehydrogenase NAD-dependent C-terminal domain-containing protein n=1 Tax=Acer negundo TaxID=4023 RepID=A0AAD5NVL3_ACENE|nr:hypothetical protein LWI28_002952 [Acer negundo]
MINRYFPAHKLPDNVIATTDAKVALLGADHCLHAVPVQNDMDKVKYYCVQLVTPDDSSDVTGVEIAVALQNVLAIAAGIMDRMNLGSNSMAALVAQGCLEI